MEAILGLSAKVGKTFSTIVAKLDRSCVKHKTDASEGKEPGRGVLESFGRTIFKPTTKSAYGNKQQSAEGLLDILSKADLYLGVALSKRSKPKLTRWMGQHGVESKLEKAHHAIANFANGGMRNSLSDNLSLTGIADYNLRLELLTTI